MKLLNVMVSVCVMLHASSLFAVWSRATKVGVGGVALCGLAMPIVHGSDIKLPVVDKKTGIGVALLVAGATTGAMVRHRRLPENLLQRATKLCEQARPDPFHYYLSRPSYRQVMYELRVRRGELYKAGELAGAAQEGFARVKNANGAAQCEELKDVIKKTDTEIGLWLGWPK